MSLIWLASYPKSGNTWLRMFLRAYMSGSVDINKRQAGEHNDDVQAPDYEKVSPVPLKDVSPEDAFYLRTAALYGISLQGKRFIKSHCARKVANGIELVPVGLTKCAIYITRDPRDVAISWAAHLGATIDDVIRRMAGEDYLIQPPPSDNLSQYISSWSGNVESWLVGPFPIMVVPYEGFPAAFPDIVKFIGEEVDPDRLASAVQATTFDALRKQEDAQGFIERPPTMEHFFREGRSTWREVLSKDQIARIENDHGETMQKLGYAFGEGA